MGYLDDLLLQEQSHLWLAQDVQMMAEVLNLQKSALVPSQCLEYLAFVLNTSQSNVLLPQKESLDPDLHERVGEENVGQHSGTSSISSDPHELVYLQSPCKKACSWTILVAYCISIMKEGQKRMRRTFSWAELHIPPISVGHIFGIQI